MTLYSDQLLSDLRESTLFLDTNVFSVLSRSTGFVQLMDQLSRMDCIFTSIPSVLFEYVRGSNSVKVYNECVEFYNSIVSYTNPMKFMDDIPDFCIAMAKLNSGNKSYTDFLLAACLYNYRNSGRVYLLTTDINAFPSFFDRVHIVTTEEDKSRDLRTFGVFKFNTDNYAKAAKTIIKELG